MKQWDLRQIEIYELGPPSVPSSLPHSRTQSAKCAVNNLNLAGVNHRRLVRARAERSVPSLPPSVKCRKLPTRSCSKSVDEMNKSFAYLTSVIGRPKISPVPLSSLHFHFHFVEAANAVGGGRMHGRSGPRAICPPLQFLCSSDGS